jgi:hypothetical protein
MPALLLLLCLLPAVAGGEDLALSRPRSPRVMQCAEMTVTFAGALKSLADLPPTQVHDAYDADRDGVYLRIEGQFTHESGLKLVLPVFAMREKFDAPWSWRLRWTPTRPGKWTGLLRLEAGGLDGLARRVETDFGSLSVADDAAGPGFLVAPGPGHNPAYLRETRADGSSRALWLFGACRAWVVKSDPAAGPWGADEGIDRRKELFPVMRRGGFNLLNQWMAPWEYLLTHHDRAEFWRKSDGEWVRRPLPPNAPWTPWQWLDQGRARDFDALLDQCRDGAVVRLLLSPLPHVALQNRDHPWNPWESNWSPAENPDRAGPEKCNGFSAFRPEMTVWDFFRADPAAASEDWRSQLFDHQANFWRYLIARWGASPAIGLWVLMDEIDGVGDAQGDWGRKLGWWARSDCDRWHADTVRLFRGELARADGLRYLGDPYRHPIHSAATSYGGQARRGANLDWDGGPAGARPDVMGWHWYPWWPYGVGWAQAWAYTIDGVGAYSSAPIGPLPRLISECGAPDRYSPRDKPFPTYPTLYHHLIWSSLFGGHAGTAMDWDDGKEFGELRWRRRDGAFSGQNYPVDHAAEMESLRRFLGELTPEEVQSCRAPGARVQIEQEPAPSVPPPALPVPAADREADPNAPPPEPDAAAPLVGLREARAFALCSRSGPHAVYGWVFAAGDRAVFKLCGLGEGEFVLTWYDPWTGRPVPGLAPQTLRANALDAANRPCLMLDAAPALRLIRAAAPPFIAQSRLARGDDVAFKLLPR